LFYNKDAIKHDELMSKLTEVMCISFNICAQLANNNFMTLNNHIICY